MRDLAFEVVETWRIVREQDGCSCEPIRRGEVADITPTVGVAIPKVAGFHHLFLRRLTGGTGARAPVPMSVDAGAGKNPWVTGAGTTDLLLYFLLLDPDRSCREPQAEDDLLCRRSEPV